MLRTVAVILTIFVALEHFGFLALEMFLWDKPMGLMTFHTTQEFATASKALAANQGLYNGFLAVGLLWSLWRGRRDAKMFFLGCVVVAGLYGAATAMLSILFLQALPAALAFAATLASQAPDAVKS